MQDELRARAGAQGGVFTTRDVTRAGISPAQRVTLLSSGDWVTLRRGVYAERRLAEACHADPRAWHALGAAVALAARQPAFASGVSAACVLGLEVLGRPASVISLTRPAETWASNGGRSGALRMLSAALPSAHRFRHGGVPTTAVARTVVDVARCLPMRDAVVVADSAMRLYGVSRADLREVLREERDWPGSMAAWSALEQADPRSESVLETVGRLSCVAHGLPRPLSQVWLGEDRPEIRVNFYFPQFRTVGEADGRVKYTNPRVLWEEKKRQDRLGDIGFEVVRFDNNDATRDGGGLAARFLRAFGRGATGTGRTFEDPYWWIAGRIAAWDDRWDAADAELAWWLRRLGR